MTISKKALTDAIRCYEQDEPPDCRVKHNALVLAAAKAHAATLKDDSPTLKEIAGSGLWNARAADLLSRLDKFRQEWRTQGAEARFDTAFFLTQTFLDSLP